MASITRTEALLVSHAQVLGAYIDTNETDQLLTRIPKLKVVGDSLQVTKYTRASQLATSSFVTSGGTADASATSYTSPARSFPLRRIATRVEVAGDVAQNVSMINDVFEEQIQAKMLSMWNTVSTKLIYGTNADPEPAGIQQLASEHPDGVGSLGTGVTLAALDTMIQRVRPWDGGSPRAFVMNRGQYSKVAAAAHASGFDLPILPDPVLGKPVAHYMGVPLLVSDFITDTESTTKTSIYLVYLGRREGEPQFGGLVWFYNGDTGPGIRVDGPMRTSGTTDLLYATLELNIGFASLSTGSVYRMSNITP